MKMTIAEFKEKVENVENLVFKEYHKNGNFLCYYWQAQGKNKDIKKYMIEQLSTKLTLTDAYRVQEDHIEKGKNKWIPKEKIDNIIHTITEANSYEQINPESVYIRETKITQQGIYQQTEIRFRDDVYGKTVQNIIYDTLDMDEDIDITYVNKINIIIHKKSIDEKVKCQHRCKTDRAIAKFDEIFEL